MVARQAVAGESFKLPGLSDLKLEQNQVSFLYKGVVNTISQLLAQIDMVDFIVSEPDLEEIFMHYYS